MCKLSRSPTSICLERMEFIYLFIPKDVGVGVYVRKLFEEFCSLAGCGILSFQIGSIRHREAGPPYGGVGIPFLIPVVEACIPLYTITFNY